MLLASVAGLVSFVVVFCLVLITVHMVRPETFKLKATLTKWISFDLEMGTPRRRSIPRGRPTHRTRDDES
jgi:hypothetical protein